jgi:hypothetical protein
MQRENCFFYGKLTQHVLFQNLKYYIPICICLRFMMNMHWHHPCPKQVQIKRKFWCLNAEYDCVRLPSIVLASYKTVRYIHGIGLRHFIKYCMDLLGNGDWSRMRDPNLLLALFGITRLTSQMLETLIKPACRKV